MSGVKSPFKNKKMKYGIFSTVTAVIVIAVLVGFNLLVERLNLSIDLTEDKLYGISDKTKEVINALDEDITIYTLFETGKETAGDNLIYREILNQYQVQSKSGRIKIENRDPNTSLAFLDDLAKNGQSAAIGDIVLKSAKRIKVIKSSEMVNVSQDPYTGEEYTDFFLEYRITNGIIYVTQDKTYTAYILTGHNQIGVNSTFSQYMTETGIDIKTVDMSKIASVPDNCDVLIITTPLVNYEDASAAETADLSKEEADKITAYLQNGGRALIIIDYLPVELPNLTAVMSNYGIKSGNYYIFEGDSDHYYPDQNFVIFPITASHAITSTINAAGLYTIVYASNGISVLENRRDSVLIEPLLQTSGLAFGKNNPEAASFNKEEGDLDGPFNVAVAVTDTNNGVVTKLVSVGSISILNEQLDQMNYGSNAEFFIRTMNWLIDKPDIKNIYIDPKSLNMSYSIMFTQKQAMYISIFASAVFPLMIFGLGFFIWYRRKNM